MWCVELVLLRKDRVQSTPVRSRQVHGKVGKEGGDWSGLCTAPPVRPGVFFLVRRPCTSIDEKTDQEVLRAHELKLVIVY